MKRIKLLSFLLISFIVLGFQSCGDYNEDEPKFDKNKLVGYWAITHIKQIKHFGDSHDTSDEEVLPHGIDSYASEEQPRWDILIFDEDYVTIRGDMPNRPKRINYGESLEAEVQYLTDLEAWYGNVGSSTDSNGCPVGLYSVKEGDLIIGSHNMGNLDFISDNQFTLDYKKSLNDGGDYQRLIYTYTRIYTLNF